MMWQRAYWRKPRGHITPAPFPPAPHCSSGTCVRTCDLYVRRMWPSTPPVSSDTPAWGFLGFHLLESLPNIGSVSPPLPLPSERGCVPRGDDWGNHVSRGDVPSGESLHQGLGGGGSRGHNGGQREESCKYNVSAATVTWSRCMEHMTKQIWVHGPVCGALRALRKSLKSPFSMNDK